MPSAILLILIYSAFIALGMPDGLLGVAWPSMRAYFNLPIDALGLLPITGTAGYLVSSFFSGRMLVKMKVSGLLAASCALTGLVLLAYTIAPSWPVIVALGILSGLGAGAIDAGLNIYTAQNLDKRQMQWLHACWGIGITTGPLIMTAGLNGFHSWKPGYILVGGVQILLAICFVVTMPYWTGKSAKKRKGTIKYRTTILETLSSFDVWKSLGLFFIYCGVEVVPGLWIYTILTESRHVAPAVSGLLVGGYWGLFTAGRILAGFYTKHIRTHSLVVLSLISGLAGAILLWLNISQILSITGVILSGLSIAPIFPSMVSDTKARVGAKHEGNTIGMQMSAAALGSAFLPWFAGVLARVFSPEAIPVFVLALFAALIGLYLSFVVKHEQK